MISHNQIGRVVYNTLVAATATNHQPEFLNITVAGGIYRDCILDLDAKDVDLFIASPNHGEHVEFATEFAKRIGGEITKIWEPDESYEEVFGLDLYIVDVKHPYGYDIQVIGDWVNLGTNRATLLDRFDAGILQGGWYLAEAGYMQATHTIACQHDTRMKYYTLKHDRSLSASIARYERFNARAPGKLQLINPFSEIDAL